ncbi:MAG: hypothetical protein AAF623_05445 [Planctomycetota bacterium]
MKVPHNIPFNLILIAVLSSAISAILFPAIAYGQNVTPTGRELVKGTVVATQPGKITIRKPDGKTFTYKIQDKDENAITIEGLPIRVPAKISISGTIPVQLAEKGMIVQFKGQTNVYGKSKTKLKSVDVLPASDQSPKLSVEFLERKDNNHDECQVEVVGRVLTMARNRLTVQVEKAKWARKGQIVFLVEDDCVLNVTDDNLNRVRANDQVKQAKAFVFASGEKVISEIDIELAANREELTTTFHQKLEQKFSHLPDDPVDPREMRSQHFILYSDLSERNANILLAKLETMYKLVGGYYGARPKIPIECYVVRDLSLWNSSQLDPTGVAKISERAGVTIYGARSGITKAVVYSCDNHSVVQHEAVHAFCAQTFGSTGPVWYSEGMAEMGMYWKPGNEAVEIDPVVIDFLTNSKPKKMADIVKAGQITGDSWQAYAWRWALCHLLASNPNYARRFKKLGLNLMMKKEDSFEKAFGRFADQISFEYDQFVKNFGNGYRVDLCSWQWNVKAANLPSTKRLEMQVKAKMGWQATKLEIRDGVDYEFVTRGNWKLNSSSTELSADGDTEGKGKLIGAVFRNFQLEKPFEMGQRGMLEKLPEGQLYVRCRDSWTSLSDNDGELTLYIRRKPK